MAVDPRVDEGSSVFICDCVIPESPTVAEHPCSASAPETIIKTVDEPHTPFFQAAAVVENTTLVPLWKITASASRAPKELIRKGDTEMFSSVDACEDLVRKRDT